MGRIAASMIQTWRNSQAGLEPLSAGVARRLRLLPIFLRQAAIRAAVSVVPDSLLVLGQYRPYAVLPQDWEKEYASGQWSYMKGVDDLARYSLIVGYYDFFKAGGSILDLGCGEGILQQKLAGCGYRHTSESTSVRMLLRKRPLALRDARSSGAPISNRLYPIRSSTPSFSTRSFLISAIL
ncbi:MAG TPA: hypothetical protein VGI47_00885 [Candidatus Binataceae bacterium]